MTDTPPPIPAPRSGRAELRAQAAAQRFEGTGWLHERPTLDVVVLILVGIVAVGIIGALGVIAYLDVTRETPNTSDLVAIVDGQVGTILGALLGLIAGQTVGRREGAAAAQFRGPS